MPTNLKVIDTPITRMEDLALWMCENVFWCVVEYLFGESAFIEFLDLYKVTLDGLG